VIARLICLVVGAAMLAVGISQVSLLLVVLATALVVVSLARLRENETAPRPEASKDQCRAGAGDGVGRICIGRSVLPRALMIAACAAGLSGVTIALGSAETPVGLAVLTWLVSICALTALGLTLDGLSAREGLAAVRSFLTGEHGPEVGSVLVIAGVALVLRFFDLEVVPAFFHEDEGEMGRIALNIVNGTRSPFFKTAADWGPTYPFNYAQAFTIWLFGSSAASARTVSALAGVLCVPVVYAIGRLGWGPVAGAMAAWLLAVSHLHIHYSRLGQGFMVATLVAALTMLFLALAAHQAQRAAERAGSGVAPSLARTRTGFWTFMIAAGALAGISQHFYHATRIVPMIVGVLLIVMLMKRRVGRWHLETLGFAFLVAYAPLGVTYLENPGDFFIGLREISALRNWYVQELFGPEASLPRYLPSLLVEQTRRTLGLFINQGDLSGYYPSGPPAFDVVTAGLIWLGLGAALSRFRRFDEASLLVWLGFGVLFGSAVTVGGENGNRILIVTPAVFVLGGVALARVWELLQRTPLRRADWLAAPVGTALALWLLAANVVIYFFEYTPRVERAESTYMAREMRERGEGYRYYFLTEPHYQPNLPSVEFIANQIKAENVKSPDDFKVPASDGRGILILALPNHRDDLRAVEPRVPGGEERDVLAPNGRLLYHAYEVAPSP
jgi:hypothetical protein